MKKDRTKDLNLYSCFRSHLYLYRGSICPNSHLNGLAQELNLGNMQPFGCLATDATINPLQI